MEEKRAVFSLSDTEGGGGWREGGNEGVESGAGGCLGVMTDGLHSVSRSLGVINEVEAEIRGWCIHKAHEPAL